MIMTGNLFLLLSRSQPEGRTWAPPWCIWDDDLSPARAVVAPSRSGSARVEPRLNALAEQLLDVLGGQKVAKIFETLYVPPDLGPSAHALSHGTGRDAPTRCLA